MMKYIREHKWQTILAILVGIVGSWYVWKGLRLGAADTAEAVVYDLLAGRTAAVYRMATPEEKQHITLEQWDRVYRQLIAPRLRRYEVERKGVKSASGEAGSVGNKWVQFSERESGVFSSGMTVWMSEQGATGPMLMSTLALAWRLDYFSKHGTDFRNGGLARAYYEGLRADRAVLEAAGVKGIYFSPLEGFLDFDRAEARWKLRMTEAEATTVRAATS